MTRANYAIKPSADQALRRNQLIVPRRLIAALGLMTRLLAILALFVPLYALCEVPMNTDSDGDPVFDQYSEEGFIDCVLRIAEQTETSDHYRITLRASYGGEKVGMDVMVVKNIQGGFDSEMNLVKANVYRRGIVFYSRGAESDALLSALSALYGRDDINLKMIEKETFTAIALHQGSLDMENEQLKIKIFGRDEEPFDEEMYNESFFNLDLTNGFVYWNEKDPDYREPLIRALSK